MEIWPEGTSRSVTNNTSAYGSVLMKTANTSTGVTLTNSQQASVPSGTNLTYSNQISKTAAGTLAAGTISALQYTVEGYDVSKMFNQESSVILWVKSSVASNRSLSIQNGSASHAYVQQYTINAINTWELKVIKLPALNTCPGAIDRVNGAGATIIIPIVSGSNFQTATLNSWVAGPKFSGIGEDTTWLTGTTHDFSIAGVMLLPGDWTELTSAKYDFIRAGRNFQDEMSMSQRYYENSWEFNTSLAAAASASVTMYTTDSSNRFSETVMYKVKKRALPTVTSYESTGKTVDQAIVVAQGSGSPVAGGVAVYTPQLDVGFGMQINGGGGTAGRLAFYWRADARF